MRLAVNIGNTNTVFAIFSDMGLRTPWRVTTHPLRMPDEYALLLDSLLTGGGMRTDDLDGMIVSSVVPAAEHSLVQAAATRWGLSPLVVSHNIELGIELRYSSPHLLGADRITNAVAATIKIGCPSIIVDLGTATTVDAVSVDGAFVGGAIAPGLGIAAAALFQQTAQLPRVPLETPPFYIGTDTVKCLQSGLLYGYAGLVDALIDGFRRELKIDAPVVATGGLAGYVTPYTRRVQDMDPNLTLFGLQAIYQRNQAANARPRAG
ncbi:MAG: type III pantothenate kinase [Chloroflexota bacterium]